MKKLLIVFYILLNAALIKAQENYNPEYFLDGVMIYDITGNNKEIWIATYGRGIYKYSVSDGKWTNFSTNTGTLQQDFFYTIAENENFVWAGCSDGLYIYDKKRNAWTKRKFGLGGELGNWVRAVEYDKHENVLWIGRFKYLTKLDVARQKYTDHDLTIGGNVKTNNIKFIAVDGDSLVWFGTEVGIHKYNKQRSIEDKRSLEFVTNKLNNFNGDGEAVSVSDMLFESKNIWFGMDEFLTPQKPKFNIGGVYFHDRKNTWIRFDEQKKMSANGIYSLAMSGNIIWASVYEFDRIKKDQLGKGISLINRITKNVTNITKDELKLKSDKIYSLYFDGINMWLGTEDGMMKIKITNELAEFKNEKQTNKNRK